MRHRKVSFDLLERYIGACEFDEESTNRRQLEIMKKILLRGIETELTYRQKDCIILYFFKGMKMEQIGATLGISKSVVSRHISKAKERLKQTVSNYAIVYQED